MPRRLRFLGFAIDLPTTGALPATLDVPPPTQLPPSCVIRTWNVKIANGLIEANPVWFDFGPTSIVLGAQIPVDDDGTSISLRTGAWDNDFSGAVCMITAHLTSLPASSSALFDAGPIAVEGQFGAGSQSLVVDASGELQIRMPSIVSPNIGRIAPVALSVPSSDGAGLIGLNLASGNLTFGEASYTLLTGTLLQPHGHPPWTAAVQTHSLRAFTLDLANISSDVEMRFQGATDPLHLHVERLNRTTPATANDPLQVAIQANQYDLALSLHKTTDGQRRASGLTLLSADPATKALRLVTHGLGDVLNGSVTWQPPSDVRIPLMMRWANADRPSSLMLALSPSNQPSGGLSIPITPQGMADGRLHGDIVDALANVPANVALRCALAPQPQVPFPPNSIPGNLAAEVDPVLLAEATTPYLTWTPTNAGFERARPGQAYRAAGAPNANTSVDVYAFGGSPLALSATPLAHLDAANADYSSAFRSSLDAVMSDLKAPIETVSHETLRQEIPIADPHVGLTHIFVRSGAPNAPAVRPPASEGSVPATEPEDTLRLAAFDVAHAFNIPNGPDPAATPLSLKVQRPDGAIPDFIIAEITAGVDEVDIPSLNFTIASNLKAVVLDPNPSRGLQGVPPDPGDGDAGVPKAVIKLSRSLSLDDILGNRKKYAAVSPLLPSALRKPDWVGVIFFGVPAIPGDELLTDIIPAEIVQDLLFTFVATTPSKPDTSPGYTISAYLNWSRSPPTTPPISADDHSEEATFSFTSIEGRWDQTQLQSLIVKCDLTFERFLGLQNGDANAIEILGQFDRTTNALRFAAHVDAPVALLNQENESGAGAGPIEQVFFKGAELSLVGNVPHFSIDGSIVLRPFTIGSVPAFGLDGATSVDFNSLGIDLPSGPGIGLISLRIGYPNIRINFDGPRFSIGPLSLKCFSLGIDFPDPTNWLRSFPWDDLVMLAPKMPEPPDPNDPARRLPCLLFGIRIELMKLPAILQSSIQTMTFDLMVGAWPDLSFSHWPSVNLTAGISALGFDHLDLNLFRFIEVAADALVISEDTDNKTTWMKLQNAMVKVVGKKLVDKLDAAFFVREIGGAGAKNGFIVMWNSTVGDPATFALDWAVIGNNIQLPPDFVEQQMALSPQGGDDMDTDYSEAQNALQTWKPTDGEWIYEKFAPVNDNPSSADWIIGAGIRVLGGFFQGRFLYQEGHVCALSLQGEFLEWVGLDFGIAGAYIRGNHADEDHFYISMTVPEVAVGDISFSGGVVAFDFGVNGGFQLDLGFPWQAADGSRSWARALGAIVTPFQGSGGMYIERRNLTLPTDPSLQVTQLAAGYALQAGLGASFGGGIFTAWVTIGIYTTIEGDFYLRNSSMVALRLSGAVGVLFRGHAGLNWWVISIDVDITIGAEASMTLEWISGSLDVTTQNGLRALPGLDGASPNLKVYLDFTVYASASASACIRLGFFSLCESISVSIPMRAQYSLTL
jgi:hypothetical protein